MTDRGEPIKPGKDTAPGWRDRRLAELAAEVEQTKAENARLKGRIAQQTHTFIQRESGVQCQSPAPFAAGERS